MDSKMFKIRPNFFDVLLIALVLIVVLAAYFISRGNDGDEKNRRSYTVELMDILDQNVDKVAVGDTVIDKVKNLDMGVVTDIEVQPAMTTQLDEDTMVLQQVPLEGYSSVILTIESTTTETEYSINTTSGYLIRIGVEVYCAAGALEAGGYLTGIAR